MSINMWQVSCAAQRFESAADDADHAVARLRAYQVAINSAWQGPEVASIDAAVERACHDLRQFSTEVRALSREVVAAGSAIKREQDMATGPKG